jgi:hypothetical protein
VRSSALLPIVGLVLLGSASARAHGRFPETHGVTFHPGDPTILVAATTFGPVISDDGGETWRWACELGLELNPIEDPRYVLTAGGSLLAATFGGLQRSETALCNFSVPDEDVDFAVQDVAVRPDGTAYAVTSAGGDLNSVFRSTDHGLSWERTGEPIDPILFESMVLAEGGRIYLSAVFPRTSERPMREPWIYRSADDGVTWERFPFTFEGDEQTVLLLAVDPTDADHLFGRVTLQNGVDGDERLVRSRDGGETWETVGRYRHIGDLAFTPDGAVFLGLQREVMGGDPTMEPVPYPHGLLRSDDGGASFGGVRDDLDVGCLAFRSEVLWICADNYRDGFLLGESSDGGATIEPRLVLAEMGGPVACGVTDLTPQRCETRDADIIRDFMVVGPSSEGDDGGGCAIGAPAGGPRSRAFGAILLLVALALTLRGRGL